MSGSEDANGSGSILGKRSRGDEIEQQGVTATTRSDAPPATSADIPGAVAAEDDEDDDIGPMPGPSIDDDEEGPAIPSNGARKKKKKTVLPHEKLFLEHLPSASRYFKSFMHRDQINFVTMTKTNFLLTTSVDGHVKLWKKQADQIEFVKHYRASLSPIVAVSGDSEGTVFATVCETGEGRIFDVVNFDMINIIKFGFKPKACCWVHHPSDGRYLLAVSDWSSPVIRIYDGRGDGKVLHTIEKLHRNPVHLMTYSAVYDCVISSDEGGFVEYWRPREPWSIPEDIQGLWQFKSQTDLFEFKKVRIFNFLTGKKTRQYDESLTAIQEMQQAGTAVFKLDEMEFGRRLAVERELEREADDGEGGTGLGSLLRTANAVWDESGNFVLYPTLLGIKVVNIVTNKVVRLLGHTETSRWLNLALYQGAPEKKGRTTLETDVRDPNLFATAFRKSRFYIFSRTDPESVKGGDRDVFNEKPTREEQAIAMAQPVKGQQASGTSAVIHTTKGDIHLRLFPEHAPKAVENFVCLAKDGFYNGIIFHRVIKKFMIQTGDPLGDGTGGTSIWGHEFEDEFTPSLRHDRPYTLSMANAGPGTNGSQFFITTQPTTWLDDKHTIFGRAVAGLDVIHSIENARVDERTDKPLEDIKMVSIDID